MSALTGSAPAAKGYSKTQIVLHWTVAVLIAAQFVLHDGISEAWRAVRRGAETGFDPLAATHVFGGILVLAFALWRIALRVKRGAPKPPEEEPAILKLAAGATHLGLYALLIAMPLSGLAAWFGGIEDAGDVHETLRLALWP